MWCSVNPLTNNAHFTLEESYRKGFSQFYGNIEDYTILALLPSYLERKGSSLIYMFEDLIKRTNNLESGFYLHNHEELIDSLIKLDNSGKNVILIGVTYALLDLIENKKFELKNTLKKVLANGLPQTYMLAEILQKELK